MIPFEGSADSNLGPTGLFLGAGASVELGLPLVWELTEDLKRWLTPDKLRSFNKEWHLQGGGKSNEVIEDFLSVWVKPEMHYEAVLGHLETQFRRRSSLSGEYQHLYSWLVEMVYHLLLIRHTHLAAVIAANINLLEGIAKLAQGNTPLWIFSLNHDLIVECVAARYGLSIHSGFTNGHVSFPRRDDNGNKVGDIRAEVLTASQLEIGMKFASLGTPGINLLKIHGALDIFTLHNGKDVARLLPLEYSAAEVIETLRLANAELPNIFARSLTSVRPTNEIAYTDDAGEVQFLRRTLLAGAYKFDSQESQVLPMRILDQFRVNLPKVKKLVCIGYGFGDLHINEIVRFWLETDAGRVLEIVSPSANATPPFLLHVASQVNLVADTASSYLDSIGNVTRSKHDVLQKRLLSWIHGHRRSAKAREAVAEFHAKWQKDWLESLQAKLASLPMKDGDLDCEALGNSPDELAREFAAEHQREFEAALADFLEDVRARDSDFNEPT